MVVAARRPRKRLAAAEASGQPGDRGHRHAARATKHGHCWARFGLPKRSGTKPPRPMNKRPCSSLGRRPINSRRPRPGPTPAATTRPFGTANKRWPSATPPKSWLFLAETHYQQQARLPKSQRDWQPFRKAFAEAAAAAERNRCREPWRLKLLQAGALLAGAMEKPADKARRRGRGTAAHR